MTPIQPTRVLPWPLRDIGETFHFGRLLALGLYYNDQRPAGGPDTWAGYMLCERTEREPERNRTVRVRVAYELAPDRDLWELLWEELSSELVCAADDLAAEYPDIIPHGPGAFSLTRRVSGYDFVRTLSAPPDE